MLVTTLQTPLQLRTVKDGADRRIRLLKSRYVGHHITSHHMSNANSGYHLNSVQCYQYHGGCRNIYARVAVLGCQQSYDTDGFRLSASLLFSQSHLIKRYNLQLRRAPLDRAHLDLNLTRLVYVLASHPYWTRMIPISALTLDKRNEQGCRACVRKLES